MNPLLRELTRQIRHDQQRRFAAFSLAAGLLALFLLQAISGAWQFRWLVLTVVIALATWLLIMFGKRTQLVTAKRVASHLDRRFPELQDSTGLLAKTQRSLEPVEKLQAERIEQVLQRLSDGEDIRAPFAARTPVAWAAALALVAVVANGLLFARMQGATFVRTTAELVSVQRFQLEVQPPGYTQLQAYVTTSPTVVVPAGSALRVTTSLQGSLERLHLAFDDADPVTLYPARGRLWQSQWFDAPASTYQLLADDEPVAVSDLGATHSVALLEDQPPQVRLTAPTSRIVNVGTNGPQPVALTVDIEDDYGLDVVRLEVTRSAGTGEQVSFASQVVDWSELITSGQSNAVLTRVVDVAELGLTEGSELYLNVVAVDNRPAAPLEGHSAALIVRWASDNTTSDIVIDNQVIQVMPEYFRSQRQIIIDSEALIADQEILATNDFEQRAQSLANDQKALRLRYGQFMGEEQSGEPVAGDGLEDGHFVGDGHDHETAIGPAMSAEDRFADAATAIEPYAHFHDQEEQATLFDTQTRSLLSQALSAMWASEGELRQFQLAPSLPHQYRALAMLKRVQNRSRVFARRVGVDITPVDLDRRFSGELEEIEANAVLERPSADLLDERALNDAALRLLAADPARDVDAAEQFSTWLGVSKADAIAAGKSSAPFLAAEASLLEWRRDSGCAACRGALAAFWRQYAPANGALPGRPTASFDAFDERR